MMTTKIEKVDEIQALTVQERAIRALGLSERENELKSLAAKNVDVTEIRTDDDYKLVHSARMELKNERIDIEKRGKEARDDANAFAKAVIAHEKHLIGIIQPEEHRLHRLQKDHDEKAERERQAKIEAEQKRVETIQDRIGDIRDSVERVLRFGEPDPKQIAKEIEGLEKLSVDESSFDEFAQQAADAKGATLSRLKELHSAALEREAEQERIKAERAELEKLRAEQAEREAKERAEREAKEAEERKVREAAERKERERLEAERKEQEAARAKIAAEQKRLDDERKALDAEKEKERKAKELAERQAAERKAKAEEAARKAKFPGTDAIIEAITEYFDVSQEVAHNWITELRTQRAA